MLIMAAALTQSASAQFPGSKITWNGFNGYNFNHDGQACKIILPKTAAAGTPWIWRARFFGHEPQADIALLNRGYHLVYMDVANLFGAPSAVKHWDNFYKLLTEKYGFSKKATLEGMSRGGLIIYNWAAANPEKVNCIYGDNPVCDIKSWPGGKGKSQGSPNEWKLCLKAYNFKDEVEALAYKHNPIDNLDPIAAAKIPLLIVCGEVDRVVPLAENTSILAENYSKLGGDITIIKKPHNDHHPHSLKDPARIVNFVLNNTPGMESAKRMPETTPFGYDYFKLRSGLKNSRITFERTGHGRVAFLGGSITRMDNGWRDMVAQELQKRFPNTKFDFIDAGIPSTGSVPGSFRMQRDVFSHGPVDLLFEEAAVNDSTNRGGQPQAWLRGMEGIIRQARLTNPNIDIIMLDFVDPDKIKTFRSGKTPEVIKVHEKIAAYYKIPSINLAQEVAERIYAGEFTWKDDFRCLHPAPFGHRLYRDSIARLFDAAWAKPLTNRNTIRPYPLPAKPLDPESYFHGRMVIPTAITPAAGWKIDPKWKPSKGGTRPGFVNVPALISETPGAEQTIKFNGKAIGIFVAAGYDAGILEYRIDNGDWQTRDLFTPWSRGLHIPWANILADGLTPADHTLTIRISDKKNAASQGHACRIINILVN